MECLLITSPVEQTVISKKKKSSLPASMNLPAINSWYLAPHPGNKFYIHLQVLSTEFVCY